MECVAEGRVSSVDDVDYWCSVLYHVYSEPVVSSSGAVQCNLTCEYDRQRVQKFGYEVVSSFVGGWCSRRHIVQFVLYSIKENVECISLCMFVYSVVKHGKECV